MNRPFLLSVLIIAGCSSRAETTPSAPLDQSAQEQASAQSPSAALPPAAKIPVACEAGDTTLYHCDFGDAEVAACVHGDDVIYRYGPGDDAALVITRRIGNPGLVQDGLRGGGGGSQASLAFTQANYDYVVWSATYGELTEVAGQSRSGVVVLKEGQEVFSRQCPQDAPVHRLSETAIPTGVLPQTDASKSMWF